jgi:glycosyltransferase involved in cell wall biosynthesis
MLIIDDGSTDQTTSIIQDYATRDVRIRYLTTRHNSGKPSIAKNIALKEAKGEYLAFLDSDDLWMPNKLQIQLGKLKSSECALCYTGGYYIDKDSKIISKFIPKYENGNIFNKLLYRYEINNQSVLVKKDVLRPFDESITIGEDFDLFMEIAMRYQVCSVKDYLVKYRIHDKSITKSSKNLADGTLKFLKKNNKKINKFSLGYLLTLLRVIRFIFFRK